MSGEDLAPLAETPPTGTTSPDMRYPFVDVLRVGVIAWVVAHHAAQAYGPTGGEWPIGPDGNLVWLGPLYPLGAAFGMGLLFFLAGYFVPRSYDGKGSAGFLTGRFWRIGLPLLLFIAFVHLPVGYLLEEPRPDSLVDYLRSVFDGGLQGAYRHLWFLGHLMLYSLGYVAVRWLTDRRAKPRRRLVKSPGDPALISFALALALVTWVVRGWYPIDEWVPFLFVVAAEPAHMAQYISLFGLGVVAYRGDWLNRVPTVLGIRWLVIGLGVGVFVFWSAMTTADPAADIIVGGGFSGDALLWSALEALICVGMVTGLVVVGRHFFNRSGRFLSAMAAASYAAYILHISFVIGFQAALEGTSIPTSVKFGGVALLGIAASFGVGHVSKHVPGLRRILGTGGSRAPGGPSDPPLSHRSS